MYRVTIAWLALLASTLTAPAARADDPAAVPYEHYYYLPFDSGSTHLSPEGLDAAAEMARRYRWGDIMIVGYADRAGSAAFNLRLSCLRAEAVKAALLERGVPAGPIRVEAQGEERALVPTADGVAERQNRYVLVGMFRDPLRENIPRASSC
jgi:OOP family OmpA-OmpF porin